LTYNSDCSVTFIPAGLKNSNFRKVMRSSKPSIHNDTAPECLCDGSGYTILRIGKSYSGNNKLIDM